MSKCSLDDLKTETFFGGIQLTNINELILGKNTKLTVNGWSIINLAISNSICLNRLDLLDCAINDDKLNALLNGIKFVSMNELNLRENKDISTTLGKKIIEQSLIGKVSDIVIM